VPTADADAILINIIIIAILINIITTMIKVRMVMPSSTAKVIVQDPLSSFSDDAALDVANSFKKLIDGPVLNGMVLADIMGAAGFPKVVHTGSD
jgi:hypothetical protein